MAKWVFLNDDWVPDEAARLPYRDLSFQRGYGIFDFFRLVGNAPLFLEDHLERFFFSARTMHLDVPFSSPQLEEIILNLIRKNNLPGTGIRLSLTGGCPEDGFTPGKPNFVVSQHAFPPRSAQADDGIRLLPYPHQRQLPQVKTTDYLMAVWLQPLRIREGADDVLYHADGFVSECPRSNFFLVTWDGKVVTPSANVLHGITRNKVIELAKQEFAVEERPVHLDELKTAREAFVTSTTKQLLPVSRIGETVLSSKTVCTVLLEKFRAAYGG